MKERLEKKKKFSKNEWIFVEWIILWKDIDVGLILVPM